MTLARLGSNEFIDCQAMIGFKGRTLLGVADDPLRVTLAIPDSAPSGGFRYEVIENKAQKADKQLQVSKRGDAVAILFGPHLLCVAAKLDTGEIAVKLDLRPVGVQVYDDVHGLHVGTNTFAGNTFKASHTAISVV